MVAYPFGHGVLLVAAERWWAVAGHHQPVALGDPGIGAGPHGDEVGGAETLRRPLPVAARCVRAASTARRSTRSFMRSAEWPFTQVNPTRCGSDCTASISGSQRSRLATGFLALLSQPRANHPSHQRSRKQLTT